VQVRFPQHARRLLNQHRKKIECFRGQMDIDLAVPQQPRIGVERE